MKWQAHLGIGVKDIDRQRRRLFEMVKTMKAALHTDDMFEVMGKALKFIAKYANEHFKAEEAYLEAVGFPRRDAHKKQHDQLSIEIQKILLKLKQQRYVSPSQMLEFMDGWLLNHTLSQDLQIRHFEEQVKKEQAAARLQAYADARSTAAEALKQVTRLYAKQTIAMDAYLARKAAILDVLVQIESTTPMDEVEQRITLLEMFLTQAMIDAVEERKYKQKLFEHVDLAGELEKRLKIKAKISYLKSLLTRDLITEKKYDAYCSELTGEPAKNTGSDSDIICLL